jgi:hypothetical protein
MGASALEISVEQLIAIDPAPGDPRRQPGRLRITDHQSTTALFQQRLPLYIGHLCIQGQEYKPQLRRGMLGQHHQLGIICEDPKHLGMGKLQQTGTEGVYPLPQLRVIQNIVRRDEGNIVTPISRCPCKPSARHFLTPRVETPAVTDVGSSHSRGLSFISLCSMVSS